jgi:aminoglycoside/choline kinase family phosphotransferase
MLQLDDRVLVAFAARALAGPAETIARMPGGASTRTYYRASRGPNGSVIVMFVPDSKPDEVTAGATPLRWPFLEVRELLESRGVRVPRVVAEDCDQGLIAIEDLGDVTLAAFLEAAPDRKPEIYRTAVRDLARAQQALAALPEGSIVGTRAFDATLLKWEIDHFREWGLEARGLSLSNEDRARYDAIAERLSQRLASLDRTFVHRDYQSRNLMVVEDAKGSADLVWIDFQDALLGPRVYDLVALLGDSYQTFTRDFIEARLGEYAEEAGIAHERAAIVREFDLVTVQRKLKDAGRFVFIDRVRKNPDFLRYVEPTIEKVFAAIERLQDEPDMRELEGILRRGLASA